MQWFDVLANKINLRNVSTFQNRIAMSWVFTLKLSLSVHSIRDTDLIFSKKLLWHTSWIYLEWPIIMFSIFIDYKSTRSLRSILNWILNWIVKSKLTNDKYGLVNIWPCNRKQALSLRSTIKHWYQKSKDLLKLALKMAVVTFPHK